MNVITYIKTRFKAWRVELRGNDVVIRGTISASSEFEGRNRVGQRSVFSGSMGYASYIGGNCNIHASIGRYCSISDYVNVIVGRHPSHTFVSTSPMFYKECRKGGYTYTNRQKFDEYTYADTSEKSPVIIGNDVWIGFGAGIISGVTIGDGAIIAAGAMVTKNISPYSIVAGVPAKPIGNRFKDDDIEWLLKAKWWEQDESWLCEHVDDFDSVDKLKQTYTRQHQKY